MDLTQSSTPPTSADTSNSQHGQCFSAAASCSNAVNVLSYTTRFAALSNRQTFPCSLWNRALTCTTMTPGLMSVTMPSPTRSCNGSCSLTVTQSPFDIRHRSLSKPRGKKKAIISLPGSSQPGSMRRPPSRLPNVDLTDSWSTAQPVRIKRSFGVRCLRLRIDATSAISSRCINTQKWLKYSSVSPSLCTTLPRRALNSIREKAFSALCNVSRCFCLNSDAARNALPFWPLRPERPEPSAGAAAARALNTAGSASGRPRSGIACQPTRGGCLASRRFTNIASSPKL
mmetsp:Transcript_67309/g.206144  ORF Transcript_67309/g.206144 Transcript_67309/m.206144 type:complete len:286 (+) Transcript_67309:2059-2916(+)